MSYGYVADPDEDDELTVKEDDPVRIMVLPQDDGWFCPVDMARRGGRRTM